MVFVHVSFNILVHAKQVFKNIWTEIAKWDNKEYLIGRKSQNFEGFKSVRKSLATASWYDSGQLIALISNIQLTL